MSPGPPGFVWSDFGARRLAAVVERFAAMPRERRSTRPYDRLLRAFLKARAWPGGRRALLDALPEGGLIGSADAFALTIDRLGYRCGWRLGPASSLTEGDLPTLAIMGGEPLLLLALQADGGIDAAAADDTPRTLTRASFIRTLIITESGAECRSSAAGIALGATRPLAIAAALTAPIVIVAAVAPGLVQTAVAAAIGGTDSLAGPALIALAVAALITRIARDAALARAAATAQARFAAIVAERRLHATLDAQDAIPDRSGAVARLCASGAASAAFDAMSVVAACIGVLAVGGPAAIAPTFAALALGLLLLSSRPDSETLAIAEPDDGTNAFRRRDRSATIGAAGTSIVLFSMFGVFAGWSASGAGLDAFAGLCVGLWLAARPLLQLLGQDEALADAAVALQQARTLDAAPSEKRRINRMPLKRPCAIALSDIELGGGDEDRGLTLRGVLRVDAGEVIAVTGGAAAGAGALLRACAGIAAVERGAIVIGGRDLRRVDRVAYRAEIAYVEEARALPTASMSALVRRLAPISDDAAARDALERAGLTFDRTEFPAGPATILADDDPRWTRQRRFQIALAGALARRAGLILCRVPDEIIGADLEAILIAQISALRGMSTIVYATDSPALVRCADRVLQLEQGRLVAFAPPGLVTPLVFPERARARVFGRA